jgi:XTP/dITP diphosphohydrolase
MTRAVLASNNPGKLRELNAMLSAQSIEVLPQGVFHVAEAEETGLTFVENAILKARHAARLTGLPALADDSGLEVDALRGAPGIYSSRFAGAEATDRDNVEKLLAALDAVPESRRTARFQCVVCVLGHALDPTPLICQGAWEGRILTQPQGTGGFGYDPVFWVEDYGCSAAQLPPEVKNRLSHRAKAMQALLRSIHLKVN